MKKQSRIIAVFSVLSVFVAFALYFSGRALLRVRNTEASAIETRDYDRTNKETTFHGNRMGDFEEHKTVVDGAEKPEIVIHEDISNLSSAERNDLIEAGLLEQFEKDTVDDEAIELEKAIREVCEAEEYEGSILKSVECKSETCILEIQFEDKQAEERFFASISFQYPFNNEFWVNFADAEMEERIGRMFMAREGSDLPFEERL